MTDPDTRCRYLGGLTPSPLALLDLADELAHAPQVTQQRPICEEQTTVSLHPPGPSVTWACHLPARHRSEEHYDATTGRVWVHTGLYAHCHGGPHDGRVLSLHHHGRLAVHTVTHEGMPPEHLGDYVPHPDARPGRRRTIPYRWQPRAG